MGLELEGDTEGFEELFGGGGFGPPDGVGGLEPDPIFGFPLPGGNFGGPAPPVKKKKHFANDQLCQLI